MRVVAGLCGHNEQPLECSTRRELDCVTAFRVIQSSLQTATCAYQKGGTRRGCICQGGLEISGGKLRRTVGANARGSGSSRNGQGQRLRQQYYHHHCKRVLKCTRKQLLRTLACIDLRE